MATGRTVVVTGAAGALGVSVARWFIDQGDRVACLDLTAELLSGAFPDASDNVLLVPVDLTSRDSCVEAVATLTAQLGPVDVLANVAGGFAMGDPVHETPEATWNFLLDLNARSIVNMAAATVPQMVAAGRGKVINVAARAGLAGAAAMGAYTASKAAVMRLTESMAEELKEEGINVNCVMPSLIDTPRNRADMPDADFSRWVSPAAIAAVIGFLASADADVIHGGAIPVNGLS